LYTGISSGNELAIAHTLTRAKKHRKVQNRRARLKKRRIAFLKKGAKIHLKNRRLHKSTQTRAPTIEILPVQSPNRLVGITRTFSGRDKLTKKIAKGNTCNVEILRMWSARTHNGPCTSRRPASQR
jgi:hypothetical protein